jgi:antitoxin YefM
MVPIKEFISFSRARQQKTLTRMLVKTHATPDLGIRTLVCLFMAYLLEFYIEINIRAPGLLLVFTRYDLFEMINASINQRGWSIIKEKPVTKTIDAAQARVHFGQLLDEVQDKDHTFFVKRRGRVAAVIMSPEDYADMLETTAEASDQDMQKALAQSKKEIELGEVGTEEDILRILRGE